MRYKEPLHDDHHAVIDERLKNIEGMTQYTKDYIEKEIKEMRDDFKESMQDIKSEMRDKISRDEFNPVRLVVYAIVSTMLLSILTALLSGVLKTK